MRYCLISCEIFYREMCLAIARSPHQIDVTFLPKGLHDLGCERMRAELERTLDAIDESLYQAIVLGYGLCNNGLVGLQAREVPLVLPRAHDCIALFLGSRRRYLQYFNDNPGTYFKTTGWRERGDTGQLAHLSIQHQIGMDASYRELVEKYGEDNAKFLFDTLCDQTRSYRQMTYIDMGLPIDDAYAAATATDANERGWAFDRVAGDMTLLQRLLDGDWDSEDFLVVEPGQAIAATNDHERVVNAVPANQPAR